MAVDSFIPELWSARLMHALQKSHVATNFVNRNYEGDIKKQGDTVHINQVGPVTIKDYTKNTPIDEPETLSTEDQTLVINKAKYFNFQVDDIDKAQAAGEIVDEAMIEASYGLANAADAFIFETIAAGAKTVIDMQEVNLDAATVYQKIVSLKTALDKANVPTDNRCLAVPPEVHALLLLDDRFVKASSSSTANAALLRGEVGQVAGFKVFMSNNLPFSASKYSIIATVPAATTYAEQLLEINAFRPEKGFADAVKGLHVYGAKTTRSEAVAVLKAKVAAETETVAVHTAKAAAE